MLKASIDKLKCLSTDKADYCEIIYSNDQDFLFAGPDLFKILKCNEVRMALLKKISHEFHKFDMKLKIINFDKRRYLSWLKKRNYCHCTNHRAQWVRSTTNHAISFEQQMKMKSMLSEAQANIIKFRRILPSAGESLVSELERCVCMMVVTVT